METKIINGNAGYVKFDCGHEVTEKLFGSASWRRDNFLAKYKNKNLCLNCFKASEKEKINKKSVEMIDLSGVSDKQINYAKKIRLDLLSSVEKEVERYAFDPEDKEFYLVVNFVKESILKIDSAKKILDLNIEEVMETAIQKIEKCNILK